MNEGLVYPYNKHWKMETGRRVLCFCVTYFVVNGIIVHHKSEGAVCDEVGKFGWKCRFTCNCKGQIDCNKETGACPNGCADGFYGIGCLFDDRYIYGSDTRGIAYTGNYGRFPDNTSCLAWNDPLVGTIFEKRQFHDNTIPGPYCRNPKTKYGAFAGTPYCYIPDDKSSKFRKCDLLKSEECPDFLYGETCATECHCADITEVCNKVTGSCNISNGCYSGWLGISCHIACPSDKFGKDCLQTCGYCLYNSCDHETGKCSHGCQPGYKGLHCRIGCPPGFYGRNCVERCGQCEDGVHCDPKTGQCPADRCEPGYIGPTCAQKCRVGRYGQRCEKRCPYCYNRGPCHPETGTCEAGCAPGFMGNSCDKPCDEGFFGPNCTEKCGSCHEGQSCDPYTGYCVGGCVPGFTGHLCKVPMTSAKAGNNTGGIIAGVLIGVVVTVAILLILLYRRRRFHSKMIVSDSRDRNNGTKETTLDNLNETAFLLKNTADEGSELVDMRDGDVGNGDVDKTSKEPIYVNMSLKNLSNPIKPEDLSAFIQNAKENEFAVMKAEHRELPVGMFALCQQALKPENKPKNRYADIIAYDHSRVVLSPLTHDPHSDYVNASYIDGFNKKNAYIASQGPNKAMLSDFWRMVWQEKVTKIVMLTNLVETCKKKCEQYWPNEGSYTYGDVTVEILDTAEYTDYVIRTFTISVVKKSRIIKQFHFMSWTDHGAPTHPTSLLNFRRKVQQYSPDSQAPILVHCSAGIGRSGTYIAVDYLLQQAKVEGVVDLLQCAQLMRNNRVNMIQTWQQYSFIYDAVLEALMSGDTTIPNSSFPEVYEDLCLLKPDESETSLENQFEILRKLSPTLDRDEFKAALESINMAKSRFKNILPANRFRPHLFTPVDDCNDFINAVFLNSYTQRDAYIVTQMPLPSTVADFWRLLYDYHSDTVVMLNEFDRNDKSCALYWPEEYGYTVEYGPLSIELLFSSEADSNITVRTFKLTNRNKGEDRAVKQFQFNAWPDYKSVPATNSALLRLTDAVQEWTRQNGKGPVTVHCMNGASKSGLYCACSLIFERMRVDMEVDVYQTVKQIRINRPQFVENVEQYQFCYQMALAYLERQPLGIERQTDRQTNDSIDSGIQDKTA